MKFVLIGIDGLASLSDESNPAARPMDDGEADQLVADNYKPQRRAKYPPMTDFADALVKKSSSDPKIQAEGVAQEAAYYSECLQIKLDYPNLNKP